MVIREGLVKKKSERVIDIWYGWWGLIQPLDRRVNCCMGVMVKMHLVHGKVYDCLSDNRFPSFSYLRSKRFHPEGHRILGML